MCRRYSNFRPIWVRQMVGISTIGRLDLDHPLAIFSKTDRLRCVRSVKLTMMLDANPTITLINNITCSLVNDTIVVVDTVSMFCLVCDFCLVPRLMHVCIR
jgi:hypothetical protein